MWLFLSRTESTNYENHYEWFAFVDMTILNNVHMSFDDENIISINIIKLVFWTREIILRFFIHCSIVGTYDVLYSCYDVFKYGN